MRMSRPILTCVSLVVLLVLSAAAPSQPSGDERAAAKDPAETRTDAPARGDVGQGGAAQGETAPREAPARPGPQRSADDVLGEMLKPRRTGGDRELVPTEAPATDKTSGAGSVAPRAPVLTVLREGTPIVNRLGRLTLGTDGRPAEFTFESDGGALRDPPLIVLPNLKLMIMEDAARGATREPRFRVSGVVTEYRGRNYLLLEKVSVPPQATQQYR